MADIILFKPKDELEAAANMRGFVDLCRDQLTIFGANLNFDQNIWDITAVLSLKGIGNVRHRVLFSTFPQVSEPMAEPFLSFAKAYFRYMHGLRPIQGFHSRILALRALEAALSENGQVPDPINTDSSSINRAAQLIAEHYSDGAAYRMGCQLEMLATFLKNNRLAVVPTTWRNSIQRPVDTARVGKEFDDRRQSKMPSEAALDALPKVFRLATEQVDVIVSSIAALLCASPDRIGEVLMLPQYCEVHQPRKDKEEAYGLRWWPAKGAEPMIKWVVPTMAEVVKEAITKIRQATEPARRIAKWYENNPGKIYLSDELEYLRHNEWLFLPDLAELLGLKDSKSSNSWCKIKKITTYREGAKLKVRFTDVEQAVLGALPQGFPILNKETGLKYSDALLVVRRNELSNTNRGTYNCVIEAVNISTINNGLGSGATNCKKSIFTSFGFYEDDGSPIKVSTHQFRHYLNTLAQAGGMSQLDIAKWSGRKDIHQNAAYDHVTPTQMLQKIRDAVGDSKKMFGPLAEWPKRPLIPRDEFARLKVPTAHTTDLGFCIHDFTMTPCQLHMDCIHCTDLVCVKGDLEKTEKLRQRLAEARKLKDSAEEAVKDSYAGSDRWLVHHNSALERYSQLCALMDDPNVPQGSIIQLAPPISIENKKVKSFKLTA